MNFSENTNGRPLRHPNIPGLVKIPRELKERAYLTNGYSNQQNYEEPSTSRAQTQSHNQNPFEQPRSPPQLITLKQSKTKRGFFSKFKPSFMARKPTTSESIVQHNYNLLEKKQYEILISKLVPNFGKHGEFLVEFLELID